MTDRAKKIAAMERRRDKLNARIAAEKAKAAASVLDVMNEILGFPPGACGLSHEPNEKTAQAICEAEDGFDIQWFDTPEEMFRSIFGEDK